MEEVYTLTVGELIKLLKGQDPNLPVLFDNSTNITAVILESNDNGPYVNICEGEYREGMMFSGI
jgi:hypothetical protein